MFYFGYVLKFFNWKFKALYIILSLVQVEILWCTQKTRLCNIGYNSLVLFTCYHSSRIVKYFIENLKLYTKSYLWCKEKYSDAHRKQDFVT